MSVPDRTTKRTRRAPVVTLSDGLLTLAQGLAAARSTPGTAPASVAACPDWPNALSDETADTGICSWLNRASA